MAREGRDRCSKGVFLCFKKVLIKKKKLNLIKERATKELFAARKVVHQYRCSLSKMAWIARRSPGEFRNDSTAHSMAPYSKYFPSDDHQGGSNFDPTATPEHCSPESQRRQRAARKRFLPSMKYALPSHLSPSKNISFQPEKVTETSLGQDVNTWQRVPVSLSWTRENTDADQESTAFAELVFSEAMGVLDVSLTPSKVTKTYGTNADKAEHVCSTCLRLSSLFSTSCTCERTLSSTMWIFGRLYLIPEIHLFTEPPNQTPPCQVSEHSKLLCQRCIELCLLRVCCSFHKRKRSRPHTILALAHLASSNQRLANANANARTHRPQASPQRLRRPESPECPPPPPPPPPPTPMCPPPRQLEQLQCTQQQQQQTLLQ
jgi:hypothetical protein